MKNIIVVTFILLSIFMFSCEKEIITPEPIIPIEDSIKLTNYIQIKGEVFQDMPKCVFTVNKKIYNNLDLLFSNVETIDTVISGELFIIEIPELSDEYYLEYDIEFLYLEEDYSDWNQMKTIIYYQDDSICGKDWEFDSLTSENLLTLLRVKSISLKNIN